MSMKIGEEIIGENIFQRLKGLNGDVKEKFQKLSNPIKFRKEKFLKKYEKCYYGKAFVVLNKIFKCKANLT